MASITNAQLKAALKASAGVYAMAAERLGTSRQNVYQRVQRSEELKAFVAEVEESLLDAAEAVIADAIVNKKDTKVARWFLGTKGKKRGFTTRQEHTGPDGSAIPLASKVQVEVTYVDSPEEEEDVI